MYIYELYRAEQNNYAQKKNKKYHYAQQKGETAKGKGQRPSPCLVGRFLSLRGRWLLAAIAFRRPVLLFPSAWRGSVRMVKRSPRRSRWAHLPRQLCAGAQKNGMVYRRSGRGARGGIKVVKRSSHRHQSVVGNAIPLTGALESPLLKPS